MARQEINRAAEMEVFVRVVDEHGFSAAARALRMTPSAVSKLVARLEARLGVRLVNRSTRVFQLTAEGQVFYQKSLGILADMEEAEQSAGSGERPAGLIRLSLSASYANHILAPLLPDFLDQYPQISLDIVQSDLVVDILNERIDVAIRAGPLKSSSLMARKLGDTAKLIVASPAYLARHGTPQTIAELLGHRRLGFNYRRSVNGWPLLDPENGGQQVIVPTGEQLQSSIGEGLRQMALHGAGLTRMAAFTVEADIKAGRLVSVLDHLNPGDREDFHAIYVGQGGLLPLRMRVLLDFLARHGRIGKADGADRAGDA